jgi:hypothetical protein
MSVMLLWIVVARTRTAGWMMVVLAVLFSGCWSAPAGTAQPRDGRAGLQLTGGVAGRQLAVSDGSPRLTVGDCDPDATGDDDVCVIARSIDGELVVLVVENPDMLVTGASLPVADPGCGARCDDITDVAVVDLQVGTDPRIRAQGGRLDVDEVTPHVRYVGGLRLSFATGSLTGSFDLVPRSD